MATGLKRITLVLAALSALATGTRLRAQPAEPKQGTDPRAEILAEYQRERTQVERRRLERLAQLAQRQDPSEANRTYEDYFRFAIEAGLFVDAEPVAERVLASGTGSPEVATLATVVNFVAEADRGAFEESLKSLDAAVNAAQNDAERRAPVLPLATRLSVLEAYYQRLVQGGQFDIVRKAMTLVADKARDEELRRYAADRIRQLDLIGKPAPPIVGTDIDGEPVSLAGFKGDVVLVVFWATWCLPNAQEADLLRELYRQYRARGLRILGVNLDAKSIPGSTPADVLPNVKRFLIEHNVSWPNVINGEGDQDYARAYGVTGIPANVLIGRDGTVIHLDLTVSNIEKVIAQALGN